MLKIDKQAVQITRGVFSLRVPSSMPLYVWATTFLYFWYVFLGHCFSVQATEVYPHQLLNSEYQEQLDKMSLEEKVGQILLVHFNGKSLNNDAKSLITEVHVGGFIYYNWANGLDNPLQVQQLSQSLQVVAKENMSVPLFIAVDQENGLVTRLKNGFTVFPSNFAIGKTQKESFAELSAYATGEQLRAVGINMNLAPVVDVNINPANPIIGIRSFGSSPEEVAKFGYGALRGYKKAHVIATLKHFPGHGDVSIDSHEALPVVRKSKTELEKVELFPFRKLIPYADAIMTAHLVIPALENSNTLAGKTTCVTLSQNIVEGLLRKQMGFQGVIMTDSLVMQGLLDCCKNISEASIQAFLAGHDIIVLGGKQLLQGKGLELSAEDVKNIHKALVAAVQEGRISQERLNESVKRILRLKAAYLNAEQGQKNEETIALHVNTLEQQKLAREIAAASVDISSQHIPLPLSLENKNVLLIAPIAVQKESNEATQPFIGKNSQFYFYEGLDPSNKDIQSIESLAKSENIDVIILLTYNAWKFHNQENLFTQLKHLRKTLVVMVIRDPQDASLFTNADIVIRTYSPTFYSLQAAFNLITKGS